MQQLEFRQHIRHHGRSDSQGQRHAPALFLPGRIKRTLRIGELREDPVGILQEDLAVPVERDPPSRAVEQRRLQDLFQQGPRRRQYKTPTCQPNTPP